MLTAEFLFDPQARPQIFTKDDDHMAMIIELLGEDFEFDLDFKLGGKYSREMFTAKGLCTVFSAHKAFSDVPIR